jgi:two-component system cell cycle sensor histidine kinase/response regulator CckA
MGDPIQLEQIVLNLGSNARDAMPEGGVLKLITRNLSPGEVEALRSRQPGLKPGPYVLFEVSDNGVGMDRETLEQVFDPFFTTKEIGEGTGLGLSTVFGIIQVHDGYISCQSQPGQGATFSIYFPAATNEQEEESQAADQDRKVVSGGEGLLLVDDEPDILTAARLVLQEEGYRVWQAQSGEEALEVYQEHQSEVEVVVLDLGMPGMGGMKCLKELLSITPGLKVIVATGYTMDGTSDSALAAGAAAFLAKPYRASELMKAIRESLQKG